MSAHRLYIPVKGVGRKAMVIKMKNIAITIGRQLGSGGYDIAKRVAQELDFSFYDKEIVEMAAKKGNLHEETAKQIDEKASSSFLYSVVMGNYSLNTMGGPLYYDMPINDKLFLAQADVIKESARKSSCVFVGRCADYVLEDPEFNTINVFIYAGMDYRIQNVMETYNLTASKAKDRIIKIEKQRRSYYDYYTNKEWGVMSNYDLCINAEKLGEDLSAEVIKAFAMKKQQNQ